MRWQRRALGSRPSRPEGLGHPRASTHTAASYRAKYLRPGPNASLSRLMRLARLERKEMEQ